MKAIFTGSAVAVAVMTSLFWSSGSSAATNRPDGFTTICTIGQTCSVNGTQTVAFGASGQFVYRQLSGSFTCDVATFGSDPIPSKTVKECSIGDAPVDNVTLSGYTSDGNIVLNWTAASITSSYQIYHDTDNNPQGRVRIASVNPQTLSYTATGLGTGTHCFWIKYRDANGNNHDSNYDCETLATQGVTLSGSAGDGQVTLHWTSAGSNSNYQIYYDTDGDPQGRTRITSVGPDTTSYTVTDLTNGTPYWFWVKYSVDGEAENSNSVNITPIGGEVTHVNSSSQILDAIANASAGETIMIAGGTYYFNDPIELEHNGQSGNLITLRNDPSSSSRPMFDFSSMSEDSHNRGMELSGNYWYIYGIDVRNAGDNGMHITGSHNTIEFMTFSHNADTGLQIDGGASYNTIRNVDSYYNADSTLENADGFAIKMAVGTGNHLYGCRAWNNLDDGYDGYLRGTDNVSTTYDNCWAIRNGYQENGSASGGDGNGFKTGGSDNKELRHNATYSNCIAAGNAVDGFDHNSNRGDITIYNSIAYSNGRNIGFGSSNQANRLTIKNTISYSPVNSSDSLHAAHTSIDHNSWNGHSISASDFESTSIDELLAPRKADGSLPDVNFFHLRSSSSLIDAGTAISGHSYHGSAPDIGAFETN